MKLKPGDFVVIGWDDNKDESRPTYTPLFDVNDPGKNNGVLLETGIICLVIGPGLVKSMVFTNQRLGWVWNNKVKQA